MKSSIRNTLKFIPVLLASSTCFAETTDPVVITATRTAQTADNTISPVIVITRTEIERSATSDITDLLRIHAGIDIGRNGGPGQQTSIFIRGTDSNHAVIMIDGVKLNPGTIGTPAIQNIRPEMIERIEIVKGPRSTLYGSDAIGGVINIITRRPKARQTNIRAGAGSFNNRSLTVNSHGEVSPGLRAGLVLDALKTDGFPTRSTSGLESAYDNTSLQFYLKKKLAKGDIEFSHWTSTGKTEYLDFFLNPVSQDYRNSTSSIGLNHSMGENWNSKVKIAQMKDFIDQNQGSDYAHTTRNTLDWQNDIQVNANNLFTGGLYLSSEKARAVSFGTILNVDTTVNAAFAQNDFTRGAHHAVTGVRYTDHETFGSNTDWNLEYAYKINSNWTFTSGIATGFRAPDATDRFGFGGNPALKPEESTNKEIGLRYRKGSHKAQINAFHNKIKNLVVYNTTTSLNENLEAARIKGIELSYKYQVKHWALGAEAIVQDPENLTNGKQLARRAERTLALSANYLQPAYNLGLQVVGTSERPDSDFSSTINGGYALVNILGGYQYSKQLTFRGRIENLLDKHYELASTYRTAERSFFAEMNYQF